MEREDQDGDDPLASDSPALAACQAGAITRRTALGPDAGKAIGKLGAVREAPWIDRDKTRHSHYDGFDLHADVALGAHDRQQLEKLLRYGARSAVVGERLQLAPDGRVVLTLKRRYHDGTSHLTFGDHGPDRAHEPDHGPRRQPTEEEVAATGEREARPVTTPTFSPDLPSPSQPLAAVNATCTSRRVRSHPSCAARAIAW